MASWPTRSENRTIARADERGTSAQRGYGYRWQKARAAYLAKHPLCAMCQAEGRVTLASVVDHIVPHKGDRALFWDSGNWQSLCARHHSSDKQQLEKSGRIAGSEADGSPKDPAHHWHR